MVRIVFRLCLQDQDCLGSQRCLEAMCLRSVLFKGYVFKVRIV